MRQLVCIVALLLVAGCDSAEEAVPLDDTLIVSVQEPATLALVTEEAHGCFTPIVASARSRDAALQVEVEGLQLVEGPTCLALTTSVWTRGLPSFTDELRVEIRHRGATDVYLVRKTSGGLALEAVETSTTRLGPR